jgi:SHS2 domain-containing protein
MWEFFEHTADTGFEVRAASRPELYAEAARALTALLVERPEAVRAAESRQFQVDAAGGDEADLLHDWLDEILYQYAAHRFIFVRFAIEMSENGIAAEGWGEPLEPERHRPALDVKAITYHQLKVESRAGEWFARVIVDI